MASMPLPSEMSAANPDPMPAVSSILSRFHRPQLAAFIEVAIDLLDTLDGDPDAEAVDDDCEPIDDFEDDHRDYQFADYGIDQSGWVMRSGILEREGA